MVANKLAAAASLCFAICGWTSAAEAETVYIVAGDGTTNSLNQTTTLGSAQLKIKTNGQNTIRLVCGILGQLTASNPDGTLAFTHTVACDDHSLFFIQTHTTITPQSTCPGGQGIIGTFHEDSVITGAVGPFTGTTGTMTIDGTIKCGFNELNISGTITRP